MKIFSTKDAVFEKIANALGEQEHDTLVEPLAGLDCDKTDMENQIEQGEEEPISTIELFVQWLPETGEGIIDWYYMREMDMEASTPHVEHGGSLLAFNTEGEDPDPEKFIHHAVEALNKEIAWAEFTLDEEEE